MNHSHAESHGFTREHGERRTRRSRTFAGGAEWRGFARRAMFVVCVIALGALIWYTGTILLLGFAGVLLAVFLDFLIIKLERAAHIRRRWAFAAVAIGIGGLLALAGWVAAPRIADQVNQLIHLLPRSMESARNYLTQSTWGRTLLGYFPTLLESSDLTGRITKLLIDLGYGAAGLFAIAVLGIYLASNPRIYRQGWLELFPGAFRRRAATVLTEVAYTLRWWVIGQLVPMTALGIGTMIGLSILHVPLAFTLGLFTGFMIFIPYIGSLIAYLVTVIATMTQGASTVFAVTVMFVIIHVAEGYLLTPLIQRRAVYLPPALTIMSQLLLGILLGFTGLALATPLTAAGLVLVKMLWLHQRPEHHE